MSGLENPPTGLQSSRRNLIRIGAIVASAVVAKAASAADRWDPDRDKDRDRNRCDDRCRDFHCFLRGTTIRTADGDRTVEDLAVGDLLPTVFGGVQPVQWIGSYRFERDDPGRPWAKQIRPIRISRGALGPKVPRADLYISQTHAVLIGGVLIEVGNLITGTTITRHAADDLDLLEYFHVELERHDVIDAEGVPCETMTLAAVDAWDPIALSGRRAAGDESTCASRIYYEYTRGEVKSCLRSAISPWYDRRQTADIIRDNLDARGIALWRQSELMS